MVLVDMSQAILTEPALEGLAADVTAALTEPRRRSFSYGRLARTSAVIAAGEIVPVGAAPQQYPSPPRGERAVHIDELLTRLQEDVPFDLPGAAAPGDGRAPRSPTIGDLLATDRLVLLSGSRLEPAAATPDGTIRIADPNAGRETASTRSCSRASTTTPPARSQATSSSRCRPVPAHSSRRAGPSWPTRHASSGRAAGSPRS